MSSEFCNTMTRAEVDNLELAIYAAKTPDKAASFLADNGQRIVDFLRGALAEVDGIESRIEEECGNIDDAKAEQAIEIAKQLRELASQEKLTCADIKALAQELDGSD